MASGYVDPTAEMALLTVLEAGYHPGASMVVSSGVALLGLRMAPLLPLYMVFPLATHFPGVSM